MPPVSGEPTAVRDVNRDPRHLIGTMLSFVNVLPGVTVACIVPPWYTVVYTAADADCATKGPSIERLGCM
jgi:hypothetical protein